MKDALKDISIDVNPLNNTYRAMNDSKFSEILDGHLNVSTRENDNPISGGSVDMRIVVNEQSFDKRKKIDKKLLSDSQKNLLNIIHVVKNQNKDMSNAYDSGIPSRR